jgi:hypothetical protein
MFDVHFFPFDLPTKASAQLQELIVLSMHTMGGWLILTQPGLVPDKKHQAALGA